LDTKISRTFQDPEAFFEDLVVRQRCLNIKTNSSYYGVRGRAPAASDFFVKIDKIGANFRKFWHLHQHHSVRLPHHSLENSKTVQDLALKFPGLSRARKFYKKKSTTFHPGGVGTPCGKNLILTDCIS